MLFNNTLRLGMPLLQAAQAQKHVTVNEALVRLDGLVNLVLQSVTVTTPPATVIDGQCWGVPSAATAVWAGKSGMIAVGSNGGWVFVPASRGMRGFVADRNANALYDGSAWVVGAVTLGVQGSGMLAGMVEKEVTVSAGSTFDTGVTIPANAMVIGAVARVTEALTGTLTAWRLGTVGADNRFGQALGKAKDSWSRGILGAPMTYYQARPLLMTAEGGQFAGGKVRLAVHWWELRLPN